MTILGYPPWLVMWLCAGLMFFVCKLLTLRGISGSAFRKLGYLFAWPGMDAPAFCGSKSCPKPTSGEWGFAALKTLLGGVFLFASTLVPNPLGRGWVGMLGLIFLLHFGLFHVLSCGWRSAGVVAKPIMNWPILATSLSDFWGRRWNTAFRDLTYRFLFRPLTRLGSRLALIVGFIVSGLIHELVISVPAGGGYGWPTLYFLLQGLGLLLERKLPIRGRLFTAMVLIAPAYGLFHPPFVERVIVPFLDWLLGAQ